MSEKKKCGDCYWFSRCEWLISAEEDWEPCDWEPSKFRPKGKSDNNAKSH